MIGVARSEQAFRYLAVPRGAGELVDDVPIPIEPEPAEPVENRIDGTLGRALPVGILDAQQHPAAEMTGIEPIEERRARSPDMQVPRRGGGKARNDG